MTPRVGNGSLNIDPKTRRGAMPLFLVQPFNKCHDVSNTDYGKPNPYCNVFFLLCPKPFFCLNSWNILYVVLIRVIYHSATSRTSSTTNLYKSLLVVYQITIDFHNTLRVVTPAYSRIVCLLLVKA